MAAFSFNQEETMSSKNEWAIIESMMTGDFNPNHDPSNGQFTSGSGGTRVFSSGDVIKEFSREGDNYYVKTELKSAKWGSKPELYSKELWEEELEEAKSSWTEEKSSASETPNSNRETVKTVNGLEITRMPGTKENYTVKLDATRSMKFRTQKEAEEWAKAYTGQTRGTEIKGFNEALQNANIRHAIETQRKDKVKKAKKAYMDNLIKQGVDKEMAKTITNAMFEAGVVKPL